MLSPNDGSRIVLLPEDKELIRLAGWNEEYRSLSATARVRRIRPGEPVAIGLDVILLQIGISLVLSAVALLRQKPHASPAVRGSATTKSSWKTLSLERASLPKQASTLYKMWSRLGALFLLYMPSVRPSRASPRGIRVNTNLLWSQILSLGGDQLFRGVFLIGEGTHAPTQWSWTLSSSP